MLSRITAASAVVIALVGWAFAAYQLVTDRWVGSTELLVAAAAAATLGASVVVPAAMERRRLIAIVGLVLIGVSASIFAYPLSAVALVLILCQLGRPVSHRPEPAKPVS